jgi:MFS family permease
VFVAADDLTVVSTLLPQMIVDFGIPVPAGLDDAAWIVSAYLIAYIVTMPFMGRVSDLYGRLSVYLISMGFFVAGSIGVSLAQTLPWLIVFRVIQALGGGAMVPVAMAVVGDLFPPQRRPLAMGVLVAVDTAGWIFGPLYGSFLVHFLSWRWQFYLNVPAGLIAALAAVLALRGLPQTRLRVPLDVPGALLLTAGLVALNVAFASTGGSAATSPSFDYDLPARTQGPVVLALLAASALLFWLFAWRERRSRSPLIALSLLSRPNLALAGAVNLMLGGALMIAMVDVPLFTNTVLAAVRGGSVAEMVRWAAVRSGQVLAVMTGSMSLSSLAGGWLCARYGYRGPVVLGLCVAAGGFGLMGTWSPQVGLGPMALHLALAGLGFGLATAPLSTAVVDTAGDTQRGVASGLVLILRLMGMSLGLSVLTAWGLRRFQQLSSGYSLAQVGEVVLDLTAQVLNETFLAAGGLLLAAVLIAAWLRPQYKPLPGTLGD